MGQFAYFHPLKRTSTNPKTHKMEAMLSLLGMRASKSYSDSGKSQAELSEKAINNPKNMTMSEWHDLLDGQTFYVTREKGTERPWTSCLNDEKRKGTFICACCKQELFKSSAKFDSGTGWPSFWEPIKSADGYENVYFEKDGTFGMVRVEVLCSKCDSHLGHVFEDGPPPSGKRYCMNGVSLNFIPE